MSLNAIGTIARIIAIFFMLICFWYMIVSLVYFFISIILNIEFSLGITFILFSIFLFIRMIYPKNVFS